MVNTRDDLDGVTLLRKREVEQLIGVSPWTLAAWIRKGQFPPPIVVVPGSPARWPLKSIKDWLAQRRRARPRKAAPRGFFRST